MVRGEKNWYRNVPTPPGKKGNYIECPHCSKIVSRQNVYKHMKTKRCMFFDDSSQWEHQVYYVKRKQVKIIHDTVYDNDDWYVWNYVYNNIIEYAVIYPLYFGLPHL